MGRDIDFIKHKPTRPENRKKSVFRIYLAGVAVPALSFVLLSGESNRLNCTLQGIPSASDNEPPLLSDFSRTSFSADDLGVCEAKIAKFCQSRLLEKVDLPRRLAGSYRQNSDAETISFRISPWCTLQPNIFR